ncbi:hypothetical protein CCACVL1_21821 [Corchorus capsularis]|uniref:Uncharacterized protein n=1 Tax=Corchorus capsularis TaxID=210143 RepID=A0A1R3H1W9_COCAP|nr:hypothetical protein CCACVL1_21821 [Corchorus capsularis]
MAQMPQLLVHGHPCLRTTFPAQARVFWVMLYMKLQWLQNLQKSDYLSALLG